MNVNFLKTDSPSKVMSFSYKQKFRGKSNFITSWNSYYGKIKENVYKKPNESVVIRTTVVKII